MLRNVQPELLDELPADDPRAVHSRRDLRRLNFCMGHVQIAARALLRAFAHRPARRLIDLGGGDGDFLLKVCHALGHDWQGIEVILVDRHNVMSRHTTEAFARNGWKIHIAEHNVFDYLRNHCAPRVDLIMANLVLHHFSEAELRECFSLVHDCTGFFLALEPRRSRVALAFSRAVGLIGCNEVTRHDAPASVMAGFLDNELSELWPRDELWSLEERPAGLFSHLFSANKTVQ